MADEPLFQDRESFEAWLKDKPQEWARVLAGRSALRVFPLLAQEWRSGGRGLERKQGLTLLSARANCVSRLARTWPSRKTRSAAAAAAAFAADADAAASVTSVTSEGTAYIAYDASAADAIWKSLGDDAARLSAGDASASLESAPLWPSGEADWFEREWRNLRQALEADGEHWTLWIDWYRRAIRGSRSIFGLDPEGDKAVAERLVAVKENFWEQPAEAVNRQIAAWIEEERKKAILKHRGRVSDLASPQPVATPQGKLDARPNAEFDKPEVTADLEELPQRQLALIRQIIAILQPAGAGNRFGPTGVMGALEEYRDELAANGVQPNLGLLRDAVEILRFEMEKPNARQEWLGEVEAQMTRFLRNAQDIFDHYPLDKEREAEFAQYTVDGSKVLDPAFMNAMEEATLIARAAKETGVATDEYLRVVEKRLETAKVAATLPAEKAKDSGLVRRLWLNTAGFADKSVQVAEKLDKFTKSGPGKALIDGMKRLGDFLWDGIGGWF